MSEKLKYYGTKAALGLSSAAVGMSAVAITSFAYAEGETAVSGSSWLSSIDVTPITSAISTAVPVVLPALISILAIRKGLSFVIGIIRKA